jgi:RND family efflux transporter MFP subunit
VTGSIAALQTVNLSPKITARVVSVAGREGAAVRRGQVVVQQDTSDLRTEVQRAEANLQAARARLSQAQTQRSVADKTSLGEVENQRQLLRQAQAQLALARRPQRTEQVAVAENAVRQAQANFERAQADQKRYEGLVKEGAAAQSVLDQYVTQERVNRAALDSARQQLEIARTGGRAEDIRQAEANVIRARLAVSNAITNLQQTRVRREEVAAARAAVAQNEAALAFARQQLANAAIRSPIDGVIAERLTEPGQMAAPGAAVVRLVALDTVFFEAQVPETAVGQVRASQNVRVRVDAYPGREFKGTVARIYPTASTQSRNFAVRIVVPNAGKLLRPGLFARGEVVAERRTGVVVAKDALLARDGKTLVFVAAPGGDKAERRDVRVGIQTEQTAEILSGVRDGERVIVAGQDALKDGGSIRVEGAAGGQQRAAAASAGG